jgi:SAM-dependent methyltransferase
MTPDPLAGSAWSKPETVAGFVTAPPNATLLKCAGQELARARARRALDIGCGAARNTLPLASQGWRVLGIDLSFPMLRAAHQRLAAEPVHRHQVLLALAPMDRLPVPDRSCDLVIAHGIWNLAQSGAEFRRAVAEAARAAAEGSALFVFTFSRNTLPMDAEPIAGESFVFTPFSGEPRCFLTEEQLMSELQSAGFVRDDSVPFRELNRPPPGSLSACSAPVIYEGLFRRRREPAR